MLLFDYLFYRLATAWLPPGYRLATASDRTTGGSRAGLLVGLLWTLTFFLPIVWLLHHFTRPHWVVQHLNLLTGLFIGLWVPAAYLFYRRYVLSHRYARLDSRWGRDTPLERTGKLLAVLVLCAVFLGGAFTIFHALEL